MVRDGAGNSLSNLNMTRYLRRSRELTRYVVHNIMQSIFSPAARRNTLRESGNLDRRDGELKMDWTKPLARRPPYGF